MAVSVDFNERSAWIRWNLAVDRFCGVGLLVSSCWIHRFATKRVAEDRAGLKRVEEG